MTYNEIIEKLGTLGVKPEDLGENDFVRLNSYDWNYEYTKIVDVEYEEDPHSKLSDEDRVLDPCQLVAKLIEPIKMVKEEGGYDGEEISKVYHFTQSDVYVMVNGFYQSYEATEWEEDFQQVYPFEKTIVLYRKNQEEVDKYTYR